MPANLSVPLVSFFDNCQKAVRALLKAVADPAECFGADAEVGRDLAQWHPFNNMRSFLYQVFITFGGGPELGVDVALFQADIVFFINDPHQSFDLRMRIKQAGQLLLGDAPQNTSFQELDVFNTGLLGCKTVKGGNEIFFKAKPVRDLFSINKDIPPERTLLQEIKVPANPAFCDQVFVFSKYEFLKVL